MVAHVSLPGGRNFTAVYVSSRADGAAWIAAWLLSEGESLESLQAARDGGVWTDTEARCLRYRDGSRVINVDSLRRWSPGDPADDQFDTARMGL